MSAVKARALLESGEHVNGASSGDVVHGELVLDADGRPATEMPSLAPRWILPLESFLGDEEPNDDDAEDWIIRDIIPRGEAALIAGPPKSGKTWAMLDLAIAAALGLPWLGTFENTLAVQRPSRVLVLAFEDGQRRLRKRVWELARAHGVTPNDPRLRENLSISREPLRLPDPQHERQLLGEMKQWKPDIVLIDNLTRVMSGDQNAIKDAKRFADTWCKIGTDAGASFAFLHHTSKKGPVRLDDRGAGDPFELIRGSSDLVAAARNVVLMRPIEDVADAKLADTRMRGNLDLRREDFVMGFERDRDADRWRAALGDRGDGAAFREQLAKDGKERREAKKREEARAELEKRRDVALRIVREKGSCSSRQLAEAIGAKSSNTALQVLRGLVDAEVLRRNGNDGFVFVDSELPLEPVPEEPN